jgi:diguanylate cyclase (GGDEF)-like protein
MQNEWSHALRYRKPLSLLIADVDYFKQFNDYYGHAAGDECLIAIANTLNSTLRRATDMVARIGGEEFVCLLPEVSKKNAVILGERILTNVRDLAIAHAGSSIANHVTISLGLAVLDVNHHSSWQALLSQADQALYRAKFEGRNRLIG